MQIIVITFTNLIKGNDNIIILYIYLVISLVKKKYYGDVRRRKRKEEKGRLIQFTYWHLKELHSVIYAAIFIRPLSYYPTLYIASLFETCVVEVFQIAF